MTTSRIPQAKQNEKATMWADAAAWYDHNADEFEVASLALDTRPVIQRFCSALPQRATILDLGCGVGRDARQFLDLGYDVEAVDASAQMCAATAANTQGRCPVTRIAIEDMPSMPPTWDGIWLMASMLHVPKQLWPQVFKTLIPSLKPSGRMYVSVKSGHGEAIDDRGRPMAYASLGELAKVIMLSSTHSAKIDSWESETAASNGKMTKWSNIIFTNMRNI